jgi:hypothetical protein
MDETHSFAISDKRVDMPWSILFISRHNPVLAALCKLDYCQAR